jgi:hypothetical protein
MPVPVPIPEPEPVISQTREPMIIDLESPQDSSMSISQASALPAAVADMGNPVAPFPDMGIDVPDSLPLEFSIKTEAPPIKLEPTAPVAEMGTDDDVLPEATIAEQVISVLPPENPAEAAESLPVNSGVPGAPSTDLNFTDMEFSVEGATGEVASQNPTQEAEFDLTTFELDGLIPDVSTRQPQAQAQPQQGQQPTQAQVPAQDDDAPPTEDADSAPTAVKVDSGIDDLFDLGPNTGIENIEIDLTLGDASGIDASSFDDMYFDDGGIGGSTEMDLYDDAYFGL